MAVENQQPASTAAHLARALTRASLFRWLLCVAGGRPKFGWLGAELRLLCALTAIGGASDAHSSPVRLRTLRAQTTANQLLVYHDCGPRKLKLCRVHSDDAVSVSLTRLAVLLSSSARCPTHGRKATRVQTRPCKSL